MFPKVRFTVAIVVCGFVFAITAAAQGGNTISGHVFGSQRAPLDSITIELLDDFSRTIERVRTNTTGRYFFSRMPAGRYKIRVLPLGTNYREEEASVEIQNIYRDNGSGQRVVTAYANEQRDFYLRVDRDERNLTSDTVFVQDVPEPAKRLYDEGIDLLKKDKKEDGYKKLIASIEAFPDYYMATEKLGLEYIEAKHFKAAAILMERVVQLNPKSYNGWYGLSYTYYSLGLNKDALSASKKASDLNPASADALLLTGTLFRLNSEYNESEKFLIKATKFAKPPNPNVHWELALLYGKNMKRYKDAADQLEIYLKIKTEAPDADQAKVREIRTLIQDFRKKSRQT